MRNKWSMRQSLGPRLPAISDRPLRLVYSYAREDEAYLDQLITRLAPLEQSGLLAQWHDRRTIAGDDWDRLIDRQMTTADVIVLLVSDDYAASTYIQDKELPKAMARQEDGAALVIPVLVRPTSFWDEFPAAGLQALPRDAKPVSTWSDRDAAWNDVAKGIRKAVEGWLASPQLRAARRRYRFVVGALSAVLTLVVLQVLSLSFWPPPQWLHTELAPSVREVIRVTSDLAQAGMIYIVRTPATQRIFDDQLGDLAGAFDAYKRACSSFSERSDRFSERNDELARSDHEFAIPVATLLQKTLEHCRANVQRPKSTLRENASGAEVRAEHDEIAGAWTAYQIRSEASLASLRDRVDTLEALIVERCGPVWSACAAAGR
jgi:hypothetical protein